MKTLLAHALAALLLLATLGPGKASAAEGDGETKTASEATAPDISQKAYDAALALSKADKDTEAEQAFRALVAARTQALGAEGRETLLARKELMRLKIKTRHVDAATETEARTLLQSLQRVLGMEDPDTLDWQRVVLYTMDELGKYAEAEQACRSVLPIMTRVLGAEDGPTLYTRLILAGALLKQQKPGEAEKELRQLLGIHERLHGTEGEETLTARHNLASLLLEREKYEEAEALLLGVIAIRTRTLAPEHRDTLGSRNALAVVFRHEGKYAESETELRKVIPLQTRVLGPEDQDTLRGRTNLAKALAGQDKHAAAEAELREVLPLLTRVQGAEHRETLDCQSYLAHVIFSQGRHAEAEKMCRSLIATETRVLGAEDQETLSSRDHHAAALFHLGKLAEAEAECRELLAIQERVLGAEDKKTLHARFNVAMSINAQKRHAEAAPMLRALVPLLTRIRGAEHKDTLDSQTALATALVNLKQDAEALEICRRVLPATTRLFGRGSLDTLRAHWTLATALFHLGKLEESAQEFRRIQSASVISHGTDAPCALSALHPLVEILSKQGKHAEAEHTAWQIIALQTRAHGPGHAETLSARTILARELEAQGKAAESEQELRAVLAIHEQVPGGAEQNGNALQICHTLALRLLAQNKPQEAMRYAQRAFTGRRKLLGENATETDASERLLNRLTYATSSSPSAPGKMKTAHDAPASGAATAPRDEDAAKDKDPPLVMVDGAVIRASDVQAELQNQHPPVPYPSVLDVETEQKLAALDPKAFLAHYAASKQPAIPSTPNYPLLGEKKLAEMKRAALDKLIDQQLLLHEFHRMEAVIKTEYVDEDIDGIIRQSFKADRDAFLAQLAKSGMTQESFRAERERAIILNVMRARLGGEVKPPAEAELKNYYEKNPQRWRGPEEVKLHSLTLQKTFHKTDAETRAQMEALRTRIAEGADFAELARTWSTDSHAEDGGAWDWTFVSELSDIARNTAARLKKGELSGIIENESHLILFRLDDHHAAASPPFEKVKDEVAKVLEEEQRQKQLELKLKKLRAAADIRKLDAGPG